MHLSDFDKDMNQVVVESGILKGELLPSCCPAAPAPASAISAL
jgi:hypothetical protein